MSDDFSTCSHYRAFLADLPPGILDAKPEMEGQVSNGKKMLKVKAFSPFTDMLVAIAFLALVITFLGGSGAFTSGLVAIPSPPATPAFDVSAFALAPTAVPTVVMPPASPAAATIVPTAIATFPSDLISMTTRVADSPMPTKITATPAVPPTTVIPIVSSTPTVTATASPTKQPTVALRYLAVALREPRNEQKVQGESATFEWQDTGLPKNGDHYVLLLKHFGSLTWEKSFQVAGGKFVLYVRDAMDYGDYVWSIFVLDAHEQVVSQAGEERKITWIPRGAPEPSNSSPQKPPIFIK